MKKLYFYFQMLPINLLNLEIIKCIMKIINIILRMCFKLNLMYSFKCIFYISTYLPAYVFFTYS